MKKHFNTNAWKTTDTGQKGEKLISNFIQQVHNGKVIQSVDTFDSSKDIIVEGTNKFDGHIEIKTQVPFITKNMFTIKPNQLNKILNSDGVFFVNMGNGRVKDKYARKVFFLNKPKETLGDWVSIWVGDREMLGICRDHPSLDIVHEITEAEDSLLRDTSISELN